MNKMRALGTLTQDATQVTLSNGRDAVSFTLAVEKDMNSKKPEPTYLDVVSYGKKGFADELIKSLKKGAAYSVYGKLNKSQSEKDSNIYDNAVIEVDLYEIRPAGNGGAGMNCLILVGNVTGDARLNSVSDERDAVNFTVATNDGYRNEAGEWIDNPTVYHECSRFVKKGSGAKLQEALMKGREVQVEGYIAPPKKKPEPATNGKTYHTHSVICSEVIPRRKPQGKVEDQAMPTEQQLPQDVIDQQDKDIPF